MGQPGSEWNMLKKQHPREQKEHAYLERQEETRRPKPSKVVEAVLKRIGYLADRRVKQQGGSTISALRKLFLHWDHKRSGTLDIEHLSAALVQLGLPISRIETEEVMRHYSTKDPSGGGGHEIVHADLVHDVAKGAPNLLEMHQGVTKRLLGSSRSEGSLLNPSKPPRGETVVIKAFRQKLQQMTEKRVRDKGGVPSGVLRDHFFKWDSEGSGTVSVEQLCGALRSLNMRISVPQAKEVQRFYSKRNSQNGECDYMTLVQDVCGPYRGPFVHHFEKKEKGSTLDLKQAAAAEAMIGEECRGYSSGRSSNRLGARLSFTAGSHTKPRNRAVERFKLRVRDVLEETTKRKGGVPHAILRKAFLNWDADASGKLDPVELVRAFKHLGVHMSDEEALATVKFYDPDGSGEMSYDLLWKEIKPLSHSMLSHVEEVDVPKDLHHEIEVPRVVSRAVERIRAGVINAGQRMAGPPSLLPPICPRDLLMGTCMQLDQKDSGVLEADKLQKVWGELKIKLRRSEAAALVAWIEHGSNNAVRTSDLCNTVFGEDGGSNPAQSPALSRRQKQHLLLPLPPRPCTLQAQRSALLAIGKSSTAALRSLAHPTAPNGGCQYFPLLKQRQRGRHYGLTRVP